MGIDATKPLTGFPPPLRVPDEVMKRIRLEDFLPQYSKQASPCSCSVIVLVDGHESRARAQTGFSCLMPVAVRWREYGLHRIS